ncbi:hypothetical protein ABE488_03500 [Luteimonas sp. TWI662]|uniref:hypothetical protein n=1 Tax=Luteimonas sp. TWI662 TaxID=3136789 RepID=UPI00320A03E3
MLHCKMPPDFGSVTMSDLQSVQGTILSGRRRTVPPEATASPIARMTWRVRARRSFSNVPTQATGADA